ncbi:MAG: aldo/keto reductase [Alphaproteobacteria bacterium]|nr:aldo/keto reductase [Alphaproteobacteria bacterium]
MEMVRLGRTGLKVSKICLGTMTYGDPQWRDWVLDEAASLPFFRQAIETGINFFDTADMYSLGASEIITGKALKEYAAGRDEVVLATKLFNPMGPSPNQRGLSRKWVMSAIDNSLKRLGTDYVDLYQIHRFDHETPIEETVEALHDVVKAGKARYVGASSMYAWQFARFLKAAAALGLTPFVSMQNFYNLVYREEEREMIPLCLTEGVGVIPWSPLARGFLGRKAADAFAGATTRSKSDNKLDMRFGETDLEILKRVETVAGRLGVTNAQVALAWLARRPDVTAPIIGASKPHHLADAVAAVSLKLSSEDCAFLEEPYQPRAVAGWLN